MKNDHQLGNPAAAIEAARLDEENDSPYWHLNIDCTYPLGTPVRVKDEQRAQWNAICEPNEIDKFNEGDHKENGDIAEGVSDDDLLLHVSRNMNQLHTQAGLRQFYMALCDRLKPLRSRKLVEHVGTVYGTHMARINADDTKARKTAKAIAGGLFTGAVNPFVPPAGSLIGHALANERMEKNAQAVGLQSLVQDFTRMLLPEQAREQVKPRGHEVLTPLTIAGRTLAQGEQLKAQGYDILAAPDAQMAVFSDRPVSFCGFVTTRKLGE